MDTRGQKGPTQPEFSFLTVRLLIRQSPEIFIVEGQNSESESLQGHPSGTGSFHQQYIATYLNQPNLSRSLGYSSIFREYGFEKPRLRSQSLEEANE